MQTTSWHPQSWRQLPISHQPHYQNQQQLQKVLATLAAYPPLVFAGEVDALKAELAEAALGRRFLLQGGDCAERFQDCNEWAITSKLKILLQMSVVLCYGVKRPVIRVGRIAGQYGKPRSAVSEWVNGQEMPVFLGDNINSFTADPEARQPDPNRLLQGYHMASLTLNYIRALTAGGFADLHYPERWNLDFVSKSQPSLDYQAMVNDIKNAIAFVESLGSKSSELATVAFYTSHEGLLLNFEEAMTHYIPSKGRYYNLGAHMLWIGERTRALTGAHVEYCRGIANPLGLKVGPTADPQEIAEVVKALNPMNEPGRITLIPRFGTHKVASKLPALIAAIKTANLNVCWSVDPMHGNAIQTADNIKTRNFEAILAELSTSFAIHRERGSHLGGVHFELTGENVTECTGGAEGLAAHDLRKSYETYCDPRLNYSQSLEMAFHISAMMRGDGQVQLPRGWARRQWVHTQAAQIG